MNLKIGSVYITSSKKFIKIIKVWPVGSKSGNLSDTMGECLLSTSPDNFTEPRTTFFTKGFVKEEVTKEKYPEYYL